MEIQANSKWLVALATMLGTFMEVLDTSVANVALPHMQGTYAAGTDEITWVITSYLVANAVILPITGWLGNYFGRKRLYLACLVIFTLASLGSGAAPTLWLLILMRVIQGLAGGAMVPMSQAIVLEAFPKEQYGLASAVFGIGVICGPIVGPLVGGWITDNWTWPWIFYINVPVGIFAYFLALAFVEDPSYIKRAEGRVDWPSFLFVALGLGCLEVFLNRGERLDWFNSPRIQLLAGLSAVGIALFIWRSFTAENPLVDLRVFKYREYASGMAIIFAVSFGMYGAFVVLPLFVQKLLNFTPTWAGVILSPGGLAAVVAMVFAGILLGKADVRFLVGAGVLSLLYSTWLLRFSSLSTDLRYFVAAWIFHGLGMGLVFVSVATVSVQRIPLEQMGVASGLFNLMRNEGGSVGIALSTTFLAQRAQFHQARLAEHVTPFSTPLRDGAGRLAQGLYTLSGADPASVRVLAAGLVGSEVTRQAYLMAFVDVFAFLMLAFAAALPFVLLLGSGRNVRSTPVVH